MSYCRLGPESDVYMFNHVDGGIECCICAFQPYPGPGSIRFSTPQEALEHLMKHREAGHKVPQSVIDAIGEEAERERT